ncbi:hypothetical protein P775_20575 [Puniceibacterium antarcticum]|uniref:Uncharacterized protein n=1 Tax=Puniceibacterium antarcticum TaxID=1206336 RepID=A0A2G8RB35_9RHOB|nr:hypothetical protein [Puniceibacterium antarcticum]PIL18348.1 hypothetical protein P775_20575 [Puniceibacterium antarcticum]
MQTSRTQIGDVTYNAATQSYEALVTFHTQAGRVSVAAAFPASLAEEPDVIGEGLWQDALSRRSDPNTLHARLASSLVIPRMETSRAQPPMQRWIDALMGRHAA